MTTSDQVLSNGAPPAAPSPGTGNHLPAVRREVVVITGASAGVGRAAARAFARRGAAVALLARGHDGLDAARREVDALGGRGLVVPTDVSDAAQVERAADIIERELGPIDVWINNAMTTIFAPVHEILPEEYKRATEVTYLGTVYGTMAALRRMLGRNRGTIVQVGASIAHRAVPLQAPYAGAKQAVKGFTDSLRTELRHDRRNIQLTMVELPAINTPQYNWCRNRLPRHPQPLEPIYQPEVAAEAIVWAAHSRRREVRVGAPAMTPSKREAFLAKHGYDSQQTSEYVDPGRPDNLFDPVPGDHGAHGIFDDRARESSVRFWGATHRGRLAAAAGVLFSAVLIGVGFLSHKS